MRRQPYVGILAPLLALARAGRSVYRQPAAKQCLRSAPTHTNGLSDAEALARLDCLSDLAWS